MSSSPFEVFFTYPNIFYMEQHKVNLDNRYKKTKDNPQALQARVIGQGGKDKVIMYFKCNKICHIATKCTEILSVSFIPDPIWKRLYHVKPEQRCQLETGCN